MGSEEDARAPWSADLHLESYLGAAGVGDSGKCVAQKQPSRRGKRTFEPQFVLRWIVGYRRTI
jgi:hypothetical protein